MRLSLMSLVLAGFLIGCGQANHAPAPQSTQAEGFASATGGLAREEAAPSDAPAPPPAPDGNAAPNQPPAQQPVGAVYLAYSYQVSLELPAIRLIGVMEAHVKACQEAGPRLCQLMSSQRQGDPDSAISGSVNLRGEPNWLRSFRERIARDADSAGGHITAQATTTEDLTRNIVDTEASLRASKTLRDRLQRLLESRPGRLSDLLDVERELARVQGEIDATQSNLAVMQARVDMSELTLSYESANKPLRSDTFRPLGDAFANFLGIVVVGFAAIITIIAGLLPFAIVVIPVIWALLAWRRRRGGYFFRRKPKDGP